MAIKYTKRSSYIPNIHRIHQNVSLSMPSKKYPNWYFWFENIASGNLASRQSDFFPQTKNLAPEAADFFRVPTCIQELLALTIFHFFPCPQTNRISQGANSINAITVHGHIFKYIYYMAIDFISHFNTQTMHVKSLYAQQHCYVSQKKLIPCRIRTRVFLFLRRLRCSLRHAARARSRSRSIFLDIYFTKIHTL
jgi:hypothetical protein